MESNAILFVGNLSSVANDIFLHLLFAAYGDVKQIELHGEGNERYAEVTMESTEAADSAIAALHYRYNSAPNLPLIVLYSKKSPSISEYGHIVGKEYLCALNKERLPQYISLEEFNSVSDNFCNVEGTHAESETCQSGHQESEVACT